MPIPLAKEETRYEVCFAYHGIWSYGITNEASCKATAVGLLVVLVCAVVSAQQISHYTPPKVIHKVEPEYTPQARPAKLSGTVLVCHPLR
jgi:hypothetical protein